MRFLGLLLLLMSVTPANAMCTNYADLKIGASAGDILYGELDRLICLHNEQSAQIKAQDQRISDLERQIESLSKLVLSHELELEKR